ncbi:hypothetical protein [Hamadaea tsunoensis]|uniref:hypothetical protein n=1 Tax=Hamadaea tsunoensis TaxID=53368 RepID=UPI000400BF1F|nr:hypothetical protein [Hamadaea tsunoensis]
MPRPTRLLLPVPLLAAVLVTGACSADSPPPAWKAAPTWAATTDASPVGTGGETGTRPGHGTVDITISGTLTAHLTGATAQCHVQGEGFTSTDARATGEGGVRLQVSRQAAKGPFTVALTGGDGKTWKASTVEGVAIMGGRVSLDADLKAGRDTVHATGAFTCQ